MITQPRIRAMSVDPQRALIPISLGVFFVLYFYFKVPPWALGLLMLWIPLYYIGMPMLTQRKWRTFEREFAYRFPMQDYKGLLDYYRGQWFLRQFGPKAEMIEKLGLIYTAMGKVHDAERILEQAVQLSERHSRDKFLLNLAQVKYELGKYDEAEQIYKRLLHRTPHLAGAQLKLALIHAQRGVDLPRARKILEAELGRATGEERKRIEDALATIAP